jgi:small-conductance mechanosensitive channel
MNEVLAFLIQNWLEIAAPLGVFLGIIVFAYLVWRIILSRLSVWASKTRTQIDDELVRIVRSVFWVWAFALAAYAGIKSSALEEFAGVVGQGITLLIIISGTLAVASLASGLLHYYATRSGSKLPVNSIMENIVKVVIIAVGVLVVLGRLGIEIAPMLATLGVGGLAIALAIQPTLSNLFAGTQVMSDRAMKNGDFIELDNGTRGYVIDIGWRSTRLITPYNTLVVLPNSRLAEAVITNYNGTDNKLGFILYYGVSYDSDLQKVERVALDVGREVINELDEADKSFAPWFGFDEFGDSNITFWLWVQARDRIASFKMKSELIKRLHRRFAEEGIVHNYPIRLNYLQRVPGVRPE